MSLARRTLLTLLLLTAAASAYAQAAGQPTTVMPTATAAANSGTEYYPSTPGKSYDDDPDSAVDYTLTDDDYVEAQNSSGFMTMSTPAQIGIIVGVIVAAIALFVGSVLFYMRRRTQWEIRKSMIAAAPQKKGSSGSSKLGDAERGMHTQTVHVKSEFETDAPPQTPTWKRWIPRA